VDPKAVWLHHEEGLFGFFTNSVLVALIVLGVVLWVSSEGDQGHVAGAAQMAELLRDGSLSFLYNQVEAVAGKQMAPKAFPLLGTLFIFILVSNWFGLLPGVGTIGWGEGTGSFLGE